MYGRGLAYSHCYRPGKLIHAANDVLDSGCYVLVPERRGVVVTAATGSLSCRSPACLFQGTGKHNYPKVASQVAAQ